MKKYLLLLFIILLPAQVNIRQKIAQMIMVGFSGKTLTDQTIIDDIKNRKIGSVILFANNIESPAQLKQLTQSLQSISEIPLLIATDQEGGKVARLNSSNGYKSTTTAYNIGLTNNENTTKDWAATMAEWMYAAGINLDLAPVADVNINPVSPAIGKLERSFSADPEKVFFHNDIFIRECNNKNIITALKHFPGHGSAATDSHNGFTDITNTWTETELIPYKKLIEKGYTDFVMSGHLFNGKLDLQYPASLSHKTIKTLLRDTLGFKGLVITDGMFMGAITQNYSFETAVVRAINAGNDILLYTTNIYNKTSLAETIINIVESKIASGEITEQRINESYDRIIKLKQKYLKVDTTEHNSLPVDFVLKNYPNPFNGITRIQYEVPASQKDKRIQIKVFDVLGREITTLVDQNQNPGKYETVFNTSEINGGLPSGIYIIILRSGSVKTTLKTVLLK